MLVLGATGNTGRHVVTQLLEKSHHVRAIVRSKERMQQLLDTTKYARDSLSLTEASLLDLNDNEIQELVDGTDAVVSCLGHNPNWNGLFGEPRRLVMDATKKLTSAIQDASPNTRYIHMGTAAVANPNGNDTPWSRSERAILWALRRVLPPHVDNEESIEYIHELGTESNIKWTVIRPSDLIDGSVSEYTLESKLRPGLFSSGAPATRANVANAMVSMILNDDLWNEWKFKMPALYDKVSDDTSD